MRVPGELRDLLKRSGSEPDGEWRFAGEHGEQWQIVPRGTSRYVYFRTHAQAEGGLYSIGLPAGARGRGRRGRPQRLDQHDALLDRPRVRGKSAVSVQGQKFGRHVRSLRRARGMTQEVLAERSGLSADTIRRLEHGSFSPSLETLRKLCVGLDLQLSTLFEAFELGARNEGRELADLLAFRTPRELVLATRVLRSLFDELDAIASEVPDNGSEDDASESS